MGRPKKQKPVEIIEDQAVEAPIVEAAPEVSGDWQVGDCVVIKKDRANAIVTQATSVAGRKQLMVECQRDDNDSVSTYWADEIE